MRLIDADALGELVSHGLVHYEDIMAQPTVDAVPVRNGKWIIRYEPGTEWYMITCSECGENVTSEAPCIGFLPNAKVMWDYCPYCGARMDGE